MTTEWYTQPQYIEAARRVMGHIDLDPASCAAANLIVRASRYYTKEDNGLTQSWQSESVWLNPPYGKINGRRLTGFFISKLVEEYQAGHVEQAILLTMTDTSTKWFQLIRDYPICFVNHKVHFYTTRPLKSNPTASHKYGVLFVYLGPYEDRFIQEFSRFGDIWRRISADQRACQPCLWVVGSEAVS